MSNIRKMLLSTTVFAIVMASSAIAFSQETESEPMTLTVEDAVEYALQNSRTLKTADIDLEIKNRAAKYAWNVLLPTVQLTGTLNRQNDISSSIDSANASIKMANALGLLSKNPSFTPTPDVEETESMHWTAIGGLSISWNFSLAYIQQIRAAKAQYESGLISWEQSQKETVMNIKKLFYGLLLQQENLKIQQQTLENARERNVQAGINYRNGTIPEIQQLQAQVAYENQRPTVEQAEQTMEQQLDTFAFMLGLPVGTKIKLLGSIDPVYIEASADELIEKYGANSLSVRSMHANKEALKRGLSAANLGIWTPALAVSWGLQPMLTDALDNSWTDADNWKENGALSITLAWNLTNLLPWSSQHQQMLDLKAQLTQLEIAEETVAENLRMQVKKAVDTLEQARRQIEASERTVGLARRSYTLSQRRYNNGTTELLDLRDAESQYNQAQLGLANQKFNYMSALLDLENLLDTTLTEESGNGNTEINGDKK